MYLWCNACTSYSVSDEACQRSRLVNGQEIQIMQQTGQDKRTHSHRRLQQALTRGHRGSLFAMSTTTNSIRDLRIHARHFLLKSALEKKV